MRGREMGKRKKVGGEKDRLGVRMGVGMGGML